MINYKGRLIGVNPKNVEIFIDILMTIYRCDEEISTEIIEAIKGFNEVYNNGMV